MRLPFSRGAGRSRRRGGDTEWDFGLVTGCTFPPSVQKGTASGNRCGLPLAVKFAREGSIKRTHARPKTIFRKRHGAKLRTWL
jgi:hypothetical protein